MKVLIIPGFSGGNPYQKLLADALKKNGVDVSFGSTDHFFLAPRWSQGVLDPDILHLQWHSPFLLTDNILKTILKSTIFPVELWLLKLRKVKLIWTVHNIHSHEARFASLELFVSRILARLCDRIIAHSQSAKKEIAQVYRIGLDSLIEIVPHGNYISAYENRMTRSQAREELGIDHDDMVYLFFGLLRPYKGLGNLIRVFMGNDNAHSKLLIVGSPLDSEFAEKIQNKCATDPRILCHFEFVPDDAIQVYMNAADVVVLPYLKVLTSGAALLAMSFSKPIIAPRMGAIPDILDEEGSFLYDPADTGGLRKAMGMARTAGLTEMGEYNFELAKQLRWDDVGRQTYEIYQECLRG